MVSVIIFYIYVTNEFLITITRLGFLFASFDKNLEVVLDGQTLVKLSLKIPYMLVLKFERHEQKFQPCDDKSNSDVYEIR